MRFRRCAPGSTQALLGCRWRVRAPSPVVSAAPSERRSHADRSASLACQRPRSCGSRRRGRTRGRTCVSRDPSAWHTRGGDAGSCRERGCSRSRPAPAVRRPRCARLSHRTGGGCSRFTASSGRETMPEHQFASAGSSTSGAPSTISTLRLHAAPLNPARAQTDEFGPGPCCVPANTGTDRARLLVGVRFNRCSHP